MTALFVGTLKGLFRYQADGGTWVSRGPVLSGLSVNAIAFSPETETLFAAANSEWYGPSIRRSHDFGATWDNGGAGLAYPEDDAEKVTKVWAVTPLAQEGPGVVYAGVEASGLFRSDDNGDTWTEVRALRQHPTHDLWEPGYGGKCLHTVRPDPFDPRTLYVAASAGGVYRTADGGATWEAANRGIAAEFMPEDQRFPVAGQCVHKVATTPSRHGRLWAQNHGGVYRSDDGAASWQKASGDLPADFGFPIVAHPSQPDTAFVIPLRADLTRWPVDGALRVYRTDDGGSHWRPVGNGLPDGVYVSILRDGFSSAGDTPLGLYFGTTAGSVFASPDEGEHWELVTSHLPRILSVVAVQLP
jgi:photosystem II stability/assembly factor-like uncharacterized protein